jgi:RNA recognition motif-containing protein
MSEVATKNNELPDIHNYSNGSLQSFPQYQLVYNTNPFLSFPPNNNQNSFLENAEQDAILSLSSKGEPKGPPQACLFVASLGPETDEEKLKQYFAQFGQVLKVKVLRDRSSRPYAFVQFQNVEEADRAIAMTQDFTLDGRKLRVEKAKVNRTLFLAKFSRLLTNQELRALAEEYGPVENVTIIKNHQTNKSKGCGFVKFVFREDAAAAIAGIKSRMKKWVVEWATSANDPDILGVDKCALFVGGLNPHLITKEMVEERFGRYGKLDAVSLVNPLSNRSQHDVQQQQQQQQQQPGNSSHSKSLPESVAHNRGEDAKKTKASPTPNNSPSSIPIPNSNSRQSAETNVVKLQRTTNNANCTQIRTDEHEQTSNNHRENKKSRSSDTDTPDGEGESKDDEAEKKTQEINEIHSHSTERSAFAFIRFSEPSAASAAIENENGTLWLDRYIRVQYCETPEMKYRRRMNKYLTYIQQYNQNVYFPYPQIASPPLGYVIPYTYPTTPIPLNHNTHNDRSTFTINNDGNSALRNVNLDPRKGSLNLLFALCHLITAIC